MDPEESFRAARPEVEWHIRYVKLDLTAGRSEDDTDVADKNVILQKAISLYLRAHHVSPLNRCLGFVQSVVLFMAEAASVV